MITDLWKLDYIRLSSVWGGADQNQVMVCLVRVGEVFGFLWVMSHGEDGVLGPSGALGWRPRGWWELWCSPRLGIVYWWGFVYRFVPARTSSYFCLLCSFNSGLRLLLQRGPSQFENGNPITIIIHKERLGWLWEKIGSLKNAPIRKCCMLSDPDPWW